MVLLTMTASIVKALERMHSIDSTTNEISNQAAEKDLIEGDESKSNDEKAIKLEDRNANHPEEKEKLGELQKGSRAEESERQTEPAEPTLSKPEIGNPISHGQIIDVSKELKSQGISPHSLEHLLKGSKVYVAPPPPKTEPTSEYKALMARLRREEEERSYNRMTNPPPPMETFAQRFPASSAAHAFASSHQPIGASDPDDDGLTFADVDRQMALILNVLLSIVACAAAIWIAARWWSTPARLALSMSGSILVGVAEVVVYSGYIRRVGEAKGREKTVKEVKEIMNTWIVGAGQNEDNSTETHDDSIMIESKEDDMEMKTRKRRKEQL